MASEHSTESVATEANNSATTGEPYIIGITGTRGSGKSSVGTILESAGVPVIDADKLAHEFLNGPCDAYHKVLARFGNDLVHVSGGPIDRAKLGAIVESDANALCDLEAILHPPVFELMASKMGALAGHPVIAIEIPLVHEKGKKDLFDVVWCVVAREDILLSRLMARNNISEERARHQLSMQLTQVEKSALSDITINNSGNFEELEATVLTHLETARLNANASSNEDDSQPAPDDDTVDPDVDSDGNADTGDTGGSDTDGKTDDSSTDCGPVEPNEHYLSRLREFAQIGTEAALDRMGNVGSTGHKSAKATMRMEVGSDCDGDGNPDPSRELEVTVSMDIRNSDTTSGEGCSCGCDSDCKVSCACATDCGCSCKKPEPAPPCPSTGNSNHWNKNLVLLCVTAMVVALIALLAFLFASGGGGDHSHKVTTPDVIRVEVINPPTCVPDCEPAKPKEDPPVVIKAEPPVDKPDDVKVVPGPTCDTAGSFREVAEMPGYAFRFTLNAVKPRIATWHEKRLADCSGWVVEGREADGRIVVHQEYDSNYWLVSQLVFTYFKDRSVQIDRRDGVLNTFVGRSNLQFDQNGNVYSASMLDGLQRTILKVEMLLTSTGQVYNLTYTRLDAATGVVQETKAISGQSDAYAYLARHLYGYDWFATR